MRLLIKIEYFCRIIQCCKRESSSRLTRTSMNESKLLTNLSAIICKHIKKKWQQKEPSKIIYIYK